MKKRGRKPPTSFRRLVRLFKTRFLANDLVSHGGGFEPNFYKILACLATPGILISLFVMPAMMNLSAMPAGPGVERALRAYRMFFPAYSFSVVMFASAFEWDLLFPDRRDFLILGAFPLGIRDIFLAKMTALGWFLMILIAAADLAPTIMLPVVSFGIPLVHANGFLRVVAAQVASTAGAAAFAFLIIAASQGVLINLLSPRLFRRASAWIQAFGMSIAVASLVLFPGYSMLLGHIARAHPRWLWCFPPFWFTGVYDWLLVGGDPLFARLGGFGFEALGLLAIAVAALWTAGFGRHYRRTLESEDTSARTPDRGRLGASLAAWIRSPEERAIFQFAGRMLARSSAHRLFLATYWSVGLSVGALFILAVRRGEPALSDDGLRALPFLIAFVVLSGFRAAFQFPVDLGANWLFQLTENRWTDIARRASRLRVIVNGLLPAVLIFTPCTALFRGARAAGFDALFQLVAGALFLEVLFWRFETVPFTCSYVAGKTNLFLLIAICYWGFTTYSFTLADWEVSLETRPARAFGYMILASVALVLSWKRHAPGEAVLFDAEEPFIRGLDLT